MSIFKDTFKPHIEGQILARQALLAIEGDRPIQLQQYVSGKSPWVRMTSLVEFNGSTDLAKKNILEGGSLYLNADGTATLRRGIADEKAVYGSSTLGNKDYGLRPMPGITSVSISSKGAYGSLREAVVKFFVWDLKQLEDFITLYMKPFYPVVLEWGWSKYLDDSKSSIASKNFVMRNADGVGVKCFESNITIDGIYKQLDDLNIKNRGNYEGMLGLIKNYEYVLLPNGGFECTTILISVGEIISGLRVDSAGGDPNVTNPNGEVKDEFELLLENLATVGGSYPINGSLAGIDTNIYSFGNTPAGQVPTAGQAVSAMSNVTNMDMKMNSYMQLAYFVAIMNEKASLFTPNKTSVTVYEIPVTGIPDNLGNGLCVSSYNAMTIDNSVCLIQNSNANLLGNPDGFSPKVLPIQGGVVTKLNKEYLYGTTNLGVIGNIYVNIGRILSIYKTTHKANGGRVTCKTLLQAIMDEVAYALGSVNYFDVFVENNRAVIIDKHYVEEPEKATYASKTMINISGTGTTVREHKVMSKIFEEQASMIAIAAQNVENIGSYQSSTNVFMNKGVVNRLYKNSAQTKNVATNQAEQKAKEEDLLNNNIRVLLSYVNNNILTGKADNTVQVSALNVYLNNLIVSVERGTDYKGIVPLSLEIKMDGIGGVVIGQIFTIQDDVLPAEYSDKKIGFIVTRISQEITRPDWTTTLTAQFCLLDQLERQEESKAKGKVAAAKVQAIANTAVEDFKKAVRDYNAAFCFMSDVLSERLEINITSTTVFQLLYKKGVLGKLAANQPNKYKDSLKLATSNTTSGYNQGIFKLTDGKGSMLERLYTVPISEIINLSTGNISELGPIIDETVVNISQYFIHELRNTFPNISLNSDIDAKFVAMYSKVIQPSVDGYEVPYLNENAVDGLGVIIPDKLELTKSVLVKYPLYFSPSGAFGRMISNSIQLLKGLF